MSGLELEGAGKGFVRRLGENDDAFGDGYDEVNWSSQKAKTRRRKDRSGTCRHGVPTGNRCRRCDKKKVRIQREQPEELV